MSAQPWIVDWLHLLARWLHLVMGAGWIGASFYFVWLNNNVRPVPDPTGRVAGGLWAVHGGAFYQVLKYAGTPEKLPDTLHWFKWEAYLTWLSGISLLGLVYWWNPAVMMVRPGGIGPAAAVGVGVGALVGGWLVYDGLCRSLAAWPRALAALLYALVAGLAFGLSQVLDARAAYIHVGAAIGTMMALNVFFVIIPGQRAMVDAMIRGEAPPIERGKAGAMRSLHNNYFTLPVLFIMVSNHFPFTYGHPLGWAVLAALGLLGAGVRHGFILHEQGHKAQWLVPALAVGMFSLAFVSHGPAPAAQPVDPSAYADVARIVTDRCTPCHATSPTWPGITEAPKGFRLDQPELLPAQAGMIRMQAVDSQIMPLGNVTKMTPEERAQLAAWIAAGAPALR